jgi:hypothetical protein|nr:MAG: hypothetical protein [Bacteriophage sp.]
MDSEKIIGCICGIVGLFGIGYAIGASSKLKSVSDAVNKSVDSIIADGKVDIPKEMIDETIQNNVKEMVETTARWKVNDACNKAVREVETSLFNKISESAENAVKQAYKSMEIDAKEKIAKELRNIDVSDLKNEVKEEAAQLVKDKLSSQMDDILDTYNANLMNVQNIYSSIAKSMSARA